MSEERVMHRVGIAVSAAGLCSTVPPNVANMVRGILERITMGHLPIGNNVAGTFPDAYPGPEVTVVIGWENGSQIELRYNLIDPARPALDHVLVGTTANGPNFGYNTSDKPSLVMTCVVMTEVDFTDADVIKSIPHEYAGKHTIKADRGSMAYIGRTVGLTRPEFLAWVDAMDARYGGIDNPDV